MFRRSYRGLFEGNLFSDDPGPLSYMFGRSWRLFEGNLFSDDPGPLRGKLDHIMLYRVHLIQLENNTESIRYIETFIIIVTKYKHILTYMGVVVC